MEPDENDAIPVPDDGLETGGDENGDDPRGGNRSTELYGGGGNCDGIAEIDIMFVYTPAALNVAGSVAAMELRCGQAIAKANLAYHNSEIQTRVRVVHVAPVDYAEYVPEDPNEPNPWGVNLSRLCDPNDGYMDEVHPWRDQYGADAITLVLTGGGGKGYLMTKLTVGFERYALNLVSPGSLNGYTFAHELGHNLGCHHDHNEMDSGGLYGYTLGHHFTDNNEILRRTVMAYSPGSQVPYFSNPDVLYDGVPTGVIPGDPNDADNATGINTSARIVIGAYEFQFCPADLDGDGQVNLADLARLLGHYGQTGVGYADGDLDLDGDVDLADLAELLGHYGATCE